MKMPCFNESQWEQSIIALLQEQGSEKAEGDSLLPKIKDGGCSHRYFMIPFRIFARTLLTAGL